MMSGEVIVHGSAGNGAAAAIRGGTVVIHGDAAARAGRVDERRHSAGRRQLRLHGRIHGAEGQTRGLRRRRRRLRGFVCTRRSASSAASIDGLGTDAVIRETCARRRRVARLHAGAIPARMRGRRGARISRKSSPDASSGTSISANGSSGRRRCEATSFTTSGTFPPAVIDDIQAKAASGLYRIRGWGTLRERRWATFRRSHFLAVLADAYPAGGLSREVLDQDRAGHALREEADRTRHSGDDHRHELGRAVVQRQGGAGAGRAHGRFVQHDRRRRHA